jgi:NADH-quinone oxidoreductase subunit E
MLRGAEALIDVCKRRISEHPHELSEDGQFSWEEVECLGCCANAPMVQIWKDTYEDLTPEALEKILAAFARGAQPKAGSQIGRKTSAPEGAVTTLVDPALYDGSQIGAWRARFPELQDEGAAAGSQPADKSKG